MSNPLQLLWLFWISSRPPYRLSLCDVSTGLDIQLECYAFKHWTFQRNTYVSAHSLHYAENILCHNFFYFHFHLLICYEFFRKINKKKIWNTSMLSMLKITVRWRLTTTHRLSLTFSSKAEYKIMCNSHFTTIVEQFQWDLTVKSTYFDSFSRSQSEILRVFTILH